MQITKIILVSIQRTVGAATKQGKAESGYKGVQFGKRQLLGTKGEAEISCMLFNYLHKFTYDILKAKYLAGFETGYTSQNNGSVTRFYF